MTTKCLGENKDLICSQRESCDRYQPLSSDGVYFVDLPVSMLQGECDMFIEKEISNA
jgi:hypothetical protein